MITWKNKGTLGTFTPKSTSRLIPVAEMSIWSSQFEHVLLILVISIQKTFQSVLIKKKKQKS